MVTFKILRCDGGARRYDVFEVRVRGGMSVLEGLFQIQDEQDGSLAFRYSCRGAVCGSCAMSINRVVRLACRTQISQILGERVVDLQGGGVFGKPVVYHQRDTILIEPLPNLPVVKDLIVDMKRFYEHCHSVRPYFTPESGISTTGAGEYLMLPEEEGKIKDYVNCILCAACYGVCPVVARDEAYLGPAALAKAWRFYADSRCGDKLERLERVNSEQGIWGCDVVYRCVKVCPKKLSPTLAITSFRREALKTNIKKIIKK
jgi:succinate dehydrogenase / fumarate reductase iron-sulfur subunit